MCLTIATVPKCAREGNLVPCFKSFCLRRDYETGRLSYVTPYQKAEIPNDGVMIPEGKLGKIRYDGTIQGGAIHAHTRFGYRSGMASISAYAFGVVAYGHKCGADLACKLLYIPDFDKSDQKEKRMATIKKWNNRTMRPTNAEVKKLFPNFNPLVVEK